MVRGRIAAEEVNSRMVPSWVKVDYRRTLDELALHSDANEAREHVLELARHAIKRGKLRNLLKASFKVKQTAASAGWSGILSSMHTREEEDQRVLRKQLRVAKARDLRERHIEKEPPTRLYLEGTLRIAVDVPVLLAAVLYYDEEAGNELIGRARSKAKQLMSEQSECGFSYVGHKGVKHQLFLAVPRYEYDKEGNPTTEEPALQRTRGGNRELWFDLIWEVDPLRIRKAMAGFHEVATRAKRLIREMRASGDSYQAIADKLNGKAAGGRKTSTPSGDREWHPSVVRKIEGESNMWPTKRQLSKKLHRPAKSLDRILERMQVSREVRPVAGTGGAGKQYQLIR